MPLVRGMSDVVPVRAGSGVGGGSGNRAVDTGGLRCACCPHTCGGEREKKTLAPSHIPVLRHTGRSVDLCRAVQDSGHASRSWRR